MVTHLPLQDIKSKLNFKQFYVYGYVIHHQITGEYKVIMVSIFNIAMYFVWVYCSYRIMNEVRVQREWRPSQGV